MDAFELADAFEAFVEREWPGQSEDRGALYGYFSDWAETDGDMVAATEGNHALLLQTFIIVVARFYAYPERFEAICEFVTQPIDTYNLDRRFLSGVLDGESWHDQIVRRLRAA